jgi:hypothetical protein
MPKRYNIRWSDKDEKNLKRVIRNFNAKVDRLIKQNPEFIDYYPEKMSYKKIKKGVKVKQEDGITKTVGGIKTRQDLDRIVNSISRFSRRGAEKIITSKAGATKTQYAFKEASIKTGVINRLKSIEAKKLGIDVTKGNLGQLEAENLLPKRPVEDIPEDSFDKAMETLEKEIMSFYDEERKEHFLENYMLALERNLGEYAEEVQRIVLQVNLDVFVEQARSNPFVIIKFIYNKIDAEIIAETLIEEWNNFR